MQKFLWLESSIIELSAWRPESCAMFKLICRHAFDLKFSQNRECFLLINKLSFEIWTHLLASLFASGSVNNFSSSTKAKTIQIRLFDEKFNNTSNIYFDRLVRCFFAFKVRGKAFERSNSIKLRVKQRENLYLRIMKAFKDDSEGMGGWVFRVKWSDLGLKAHTTECFLRISLGWLSQQTSELNKAIGRSIRA